MRQIDKTALYVDETIEYRMPESPRAGGNVTFRFRTGHRDVRHVFMHISGVPVQSGDQPPQAEQEVRQYGEACPELSWQEAAHGYDWFAVTVPVGEVPCRYYFEVQGEEETCFYQKTGVTYEPDFNRGFCLMPGFEVPDWTRGAVMYQIFTDRFCNGDPDNDVVDGEYFYTGAQSSHARVWSWNPGPNLVGEFFGGDLRGVIQKLDYLKDLGVDVLYFNPLFVSPSNHKYDTQDYDYIDPHYGVIVKDEGQILAPDDYDNRNATRYISRVTDRANLEASNDLFIELVQEAHARGMKVILDGVFNHCGSFHKWLDREKLYQGQPGYEPGAFGTADSPYRDYFSFEEGSNWPDNEQYEGWWGFETLPKLNYEGSRNLQEEIFRIAEKWVSPPYNVDGWRLDVAADLGHSEEFNHGFWKEFRRRVKSANPSAVILAEHYGSPAAWLKGDEWDTVMNYDAFMEPVSYFFTGMEKHSDEYHPELRGDVELFRRTMAENMAVFMGSSLHSAMNQLSNHDHSRFLTRTNHKVGRVANLGHRAASENIDKSVMTQAIVLQMTWPGAPTLYYGDEAGVCGFTDPDSRRTYPWGNEDKEVLSVYKKAIRLHRECDVLRTGSFCFLPCGERYGILGYARFNHQAQAVVLINTQKKHLHTMVSLEEAGIREDVTMEQVFYTHGCEVSTVPITYEIRQGWLDISLPASSTVVLYHRW